MAYTQQDKRAVAFLSALVVAFAATPMMCSRAPMYYDDGGDHAAEAEEFREPITDRR